MVINLKNEIYKSFYINPIEKKAWIQLSLTSRLKICYLDHRL